MSGEFIRKSLAYSSDQSHTGIQGGSVNNGSESSNQYIGNPLKAAPEDTLVAEAKGGGHQAYVELCRRHRSLVFQIVQRITRNEGDTEDVLQESWMKAFIHIKSFNAKSTFSTWMTRIAINSALMMLRKRRGRTETSLDDPSGSDDGWFLDIEEPSHNPEEHYPTGEKDSD